MTPAKYETIFFRYNSGSGWYVVGFFEDIFSGKSLKSAVVFVCSKEFNKIIGKTKVDSLMHLRRVYSDFEIVQINEGNLEAETRKALQKHKDNSPPSKEVVVQFVKDLYLKR